MNPSLLKGFTGYAERIPMLYNVSAKQSINNVFVLSYRNTRSAHLDKKSFIIPLWRTKKPSSADRAWQGFWFQAPLVCWCFASFLCMQHRTEVKDWWTSVLREKTGLQAVLWSTAVPPIRDVPEHTPAGGKPALRDVRSREVLCTSHKWRRTQHARGRLPQSSAGGHPAFQPWSSRPAGEDFHTWETALFLAH